MRRLALLVATAAALAAAPALALTISPMPTRDQAPHLKQQSGGGGPVSLRDTLAADARPLNGLDFIGREGAYRRSQTFGFGGVTTTITTDSGLRRSGLIEPRRFDAYAPDLLGRRR